MKKKQVIRGECFPAFSQRLRIASLSCLCFMIEYGTYANDDGPAIMNNNLKVKNEIVQDQGHNVSGIVTDEIGAPLPGTTIMVKGSTVGTVTDVDGNYNLSGLTGNETLVISFVGMLSQEIPVDGRNVINVQMRMDAVGIEEVIAIGYGTQKKRDVSSAISSVSSETYKDRPVSNFAQGIKGNVAGVIISNNNAAPGGGSNIVIRGISSVNASNAPLYVVDGQPLPDGYNKNESPLNFINPADIESIEILKDAASGAIYGTRAANGVVLITTKRGQSGKPKVGVKVSYGCKILFVKWMYLTVRISFNSMKNQDKTPM